MNSKKKFWTLIALYQILLIIIIFSSINGLMTLARAQTAGGAQDPMVSSALAIAAAIAVSGGVMAASLAIKTVGTAAISALSEREGTFGKAFVIVALAEALAVYGLIIAILLWTKIP